MSENNFAFFRRENTNKTNQMMYPHGNHNVLGHLVSTQLQKNILKHGENGDENHIQVIPIRDPFYPRSLEVT